MSQEWAMGILTTALPILYDVLKWLRAERTRDQQEDAEPPPVEVPEQEAEAAPARPAVSSAPALLSVLQEMDLSAERSALDRLRSLGRQLQDRRQNINLYEEELSRMPGVQERMQLRRGFNEERTQIGRISAEMQEIIEQLSGRRVAVGD